MRANIMANQNVFYDLTEALLSTSTKRIQYYGISRTVYEIGCNLALICPSIRFVVFSFGYRRFFEVFPSFTVDGKVSFDIPKDVGQSWHRTDFGGRWFQTAIAALARPILDRRNMRLWSKRASNLVEVALDGGILFSAARPKLIAEMMRSIDRNKATVDVVPMLHDFMPLHKGATKRLQDFDRNFLVDNKFLLKNASAVFTNSAFTTSELYRFSAMGFFAPPRRIFTIPLVQQCVDGIEHKQVKIPSAAYILTVGSNLGRKNIEVVLDALKMMIDAGESAPELVIAGARRKRLIHFLERPALRMVKSRTHFLNNPNQTDLVRLYSNALALVIPSRMEGWGLPAGEALWCGTPAICSTAPVFKEVCGDLGLYFDPDQPEELVRIIRRLMHDEDFSAALKKRIADAKPSLRTWTDVAEDINVAIKQLLASKASHG